MAENLANLESQLLALTKQRVEIDSQWIRISEKLLTAKARISIPQDHVEVPTVSENLEANAVILPAQITSPHPQSTTALDVELPVNRDLQEAAVSSAYIRSEGRNTESTSEGAKRPNTSTITAQVTTPVISRTAPSEAQTFTKSSNIVGEAPNFVPYTGPRVPPSLESVSRATSAQQSSSFGHHQAPRYIPDLASSQRLEQDDPQRGRGTMFEARQLSRPHGLLDAASTQDTHAANIQGPSNTSQNMPRGLVNPSPQTMQPLFPAEFTPSARTTIGLDPRTIPAHQVWRPQQWSIAPSPRPIKTERMESYHALSRQPARPIQQDSDARRPPPGNFPHPSQPLVSSSMDRLGQFPQSTYQSSRYPQSTRPADVPTQPPANHPASATAQTDNTSRRRQRSPSIQIIESRPRQRPRVDETPLDQFSTTPLNMPHIKVEETVESDFPEDGTRDRPPRARGPQPSNVNQEPTHRQLLAPASHQALQRRTIDEDYDKEASESENSEASEEQRPVIDDRVEVPHILYRPRRLPDPRVEDLAQGPNDTESPLTALLATRRAFNSYRVTEHRPLAYAERQELELRYCARVAMIIGSKRCVMAPCQQISKTKNIFTIMREKFGQIVDTEADPETAATLYRSAADFVTDARGMLKCYVKLGHCEACPFRATGNERVMCWRMRLESVLDEKMRGLKKCLKECEENYEVEDMDGRADHVDAWFSVEELRDEVPIM